MSDKKWEKLLNHTEYNLKIIGIDILIKDKVFTPDPKLTYSTGIILDNLPNLQDKRVADIGTGTGIIAIASALNGAKEVIAVDISYEAVKNAKLNIVNNGVNEKVKVTQSNLFEKVDGKFDYIFANLPILDDVWDESTESIIKKFLTKAKEKINLDGKIFLPWASFAEEERVGLEKLIKKMNYKFEVISKEKIGYAWYLYILSLK